MNWVFDHPKTPPLLVEYLDLLVEPVGCHLTLVPEGAFSFHPYIANGSWGLHLNSWDVVLDVVENDYIAAKAEGELPSLRYKWLTKLLEQ
jgi:hypothetical protein